MKLLATALTALVIHSSAFAGEMIAIDKNPKNPIVVEECFGPQEFSIDIFGQYTDGNGGDHAGPIGEHGWGGGIGLNYFFTRNIGVGVDAAWLYADENASLGGGTTTIHNLSGSLIARFPIECVAPYVYVGGGAALDGAQWASAHAGVGVEWRVQPQKLGLFADVRWTYYGDRFDNGDQNNFSGRLGVRIVF